MKFSSNILPMPVSAPSHASGALPPMPKPLAAAVIDAETLLAERGKLDGLLAEQTQAVPGLLRAKLDHENDLSRARTAELLGEIGDETVQEAQDALAAAELDYRTANGIRASLRERLLAQEPRLIATQQSIATHLPEYSQQVISGFEREYQIAASAFARVEARGRSLSKALGIDVTMPAPIVVEGVDVEADVDRLAQVRGGLTTALNSVQGEKQKAARERGRHVSYRPGLTWELLKDCEPFKAGTWVESPLIPETVLERLYLTKSARPVTDRELAEDAALDAALPA